MLKYRLCLCLSTVLLASHPVSSSAQDDDYVPLFSQEQISKAAEGSRKRMQVTEKMNRDAWMKRRKESADAKTKKAATASAATKPAPPKYTRKGKIYKWVDAQGRIHFGDAPTGKKSEQIKLRNTKPSQGASKQSTTAN